MQAFALIERLLDSQAQTGQMSQRQVGRCPPETVRQAAPGACHLLVHLAQLPGGLSSLAIQFALQSAINLAVNLNLIPPKGMTLPFVSYGGTSMIAVAFGMGLMLAFTRKRPEERLVSGLPAYRVPGLVPAE